MKNIFLDKNFHKDLLINILVMFGLGYVVLFGLETILPGLVTEVFNLNFMLLLFFTALFLLLSLPFGKVKDESNFSGKVLIFFWCLGLYLALILFFALYRVSILESFWYMFLAFLALKGFYRMIA